MIARILEKYKTKRLIKKKIRDRNISFKGPFLPNIVIGEHSYFNGSTIYCWEDGISLTIGKYCSIAQDTVFLAGGEHHKHWVSSYPFIDRWHLHALEKQLPPQNKGHIKIGHDVWIGHGALILSGVTVGTGAVIGAGAVVSKNIEPYSIVAGNPAKEIKKRFSAEIIELLLLSCWWNLSEEQLIELLPYFDDPELFINKISQEK